MTGGRVEASSLRGVVMWKFIPGALVSHGLLPAGTAYDFGLLPHRLWVIQIGASGLDQ